MHAVLLMGLQAAGKSSFYKHQYFHSHLRINLDQLRTRSREQRILEVCLATQLPLVVDNTNVTRSERAHYLKKAQAAGFRVDGYFFQSRLEDCLQRNARRPPEQQVPLAGVLATYSRLELPHLSEGFDELFYVQLTEEGFAVETWNDAL